MEEIERAWLEEVMVMVGPRGVYPVSTSGAADGICVADQGWDQGGQAGLGAGGQGEQQAVSTMHCASAWSAMTTGGVLTHTTSCCSLPPACLSISPLCVKVELYEVPRIPRKEAKLILEQVDQASLSLSHSVLRGSE